MDQAPARVAAASDFAAETLRRQPGLEQRLLADSSRPIGAPHLTPDNRQEWPALLRRYRAAESTRLAWRDILGLDEVDATLAGSTALAE
ncbi:MAG TPA: hypothetical protein VFS82_00245, partial [Lysobacter sp.]|nr:hypothetical protein [Lysobacter sp.]